MIGGMGLHGALSSVLIGGMDLHGALISVVIGGMGLCGAEFCSDRGPGSVWSLFVFC